MWDNFFVKELGPTIIKLYIIIIIYSRDDLSK